MGLPDDAIDAYLAQETKQTSHTEVLEENWDAFRVYRACQWDIVAIGSDLGVNMPRYIGIRAQEVEAVARMFGVAANEDLLGRVHIMVDEASGILNED